MKDTILNFEERHSSTPTTPKSTVPPVIKERKKKRRESKVFKGKLEGISIDIFKMKKYKEIIKKEIGNKHGIYVLYDKKGNVFYIGQAVNLRRRLKQHLKHKKKKWERFTIYFTKNKKYMEVIEEVLISVVDPEGNKQKPKKIKNNMKDRIIGKMKRVDKHERRRITGKTKSNQKKKAA